MAKFKEKLDWLTINSTSFSKSTQAIEAKLRDAFKVVNELKADFETAASKELARLPAEHKLTVKLDDKGVVAAGHVLKWSYRQGVAVAAAPKAGSGGKAVSF